MINFTGSKLKNADFAMAILGIISLLFAGMSHRMEYFENYEDEILY